MKSVRVILIVNGRFFWELATVLAHTEALSMLRVGGRYNDPTLIPRDLQERPMKNSVQETQDTLTSWGRNI